MSTFMHIHAYIDVHKCLHLICAFSKLFSLEKIVFSCLKVIKNEGFVQKYNIFKSTSLRELIRRIEEQT